MKIAIAGTVYVGLSNALLFAQHNEDWKIDSDPISCKAEIQTLRGIENQLPGDSALTVDTETVQKGKISC